MKDYFNNAWAKVLAETHGRTKFPVDQWKASGRATKANPDKENDAWWLVNGQKMFDSWVKWRTGGNGWQIWEPVDGVPAIELSVNPVWNDVQVQMHIDRVMVTPDGELVVLDIKTGARTPTTDLQLAFYAAGIEELYNVRPSYGAYWMAREGTTSELVDLSIYSKDKIISIVKMFDDSRRVGAFIPNLSHCKMCNVIDSCSWKGN